VKQYFQCLLFAYSDMICSPIKAINTLGEYSLHTQIKSVQVWVTVHNNLLSMYMDKKKISEIKNLWILTSTIVIMKKLHKRDEKLNASAKPNSWWAYIKYVIPTSTALFLMWLLYSFVKIGIIYLMYAHQPLADALSLVNPHPYHFLFMKFFS